MKKKILSPEEKLMKKSMQIMRERRPKTKKVGKPSKKYDPWRDS